MAQEQVKDVIVSGVDIQSCLDFKVVKGDRVYNFNMPMGAPLGEAFDAVFTVLEKVRELSNAAVEKAAQSVEPQEAEDAKGE